MDCPPPLNESDIVRFEHHRDVSLESVDFPVRLSVPEDAADAGSRGPVGLVEVHEWVEGEAGTFVANVHRLDHAVYGPLIRVNFRHADRLGRSGATELTQVAHRWWQLRSGTTRPRPGRRR